MGQKNLAILTRFFLQENVWRFLPGGPKKVAVITWRPYYRGGRRRDFTVSLFTSGLVTRKS